MVDEITLVLVPVAVVSILLMLAWAKGAIRKEITTVKVEAWLQSMGIRSVNAKFLNELSKDGVQNILNLYLGKSQIDKTVNPMAQLQGLPRSIQEIIALGQLGQTGSSEVK